jgi:hypothetical protein
LFHSEHPKTDEFLISVLQLSTFFRLEDGVAYSITEFERTEGEGFDPALQFQLARSMFRVDHGQWIELAFQALMKRSDSSLTLRNLAQIGETGCYYLTMQTKDKIRKHRVHLAFSTPKISQSQDCKTRWECKFHWEMEWWEGFARLIHHPEITLSFGDIPGALLDVRDGGMDGVCDG